MEKFYAVIGGRIRSVRKGLRLTQAQVAEAAGIDPSFYGQVERGANVPSLRTLLAIARALGAEPGDLLPSRARRWTSPYEKAVERLVSDLEPRKKRLVLGMVGDLVGRLKR